MNLEREKLIKEIDELKEKVDKWPATDGAGEIYLATMQRILIELKDELTSTWIGDSFIKIKTDFSQAELEYINDILYLISGMLEIFETGGVY